MWEFVNAGLARMMSYSNYKITAKRADKLADFVFDCSAAAVAILISFGIGCVTDTESLKRQLKYPVSLVIGFCCQFLVMPVVSQYNHAILNYDAINQCLQHFEFVDGMYLWYRSSWAVQILNFRHLSMYTMQYQ